MRISQILKNLRYPLNSGQNLVDLEPDIIQYHTHDNIADIIIGNHQVDPHFETI
ncbi:hypothetical protein LCGC14_1917740 [marine sediment metagenome]|uniref:Uncharacterized protein n=1 Tax=marine sediment metagenome TaxID=412755 RepID=A0A0F9IPI0_9ZZZZ